MSYGRENYVLDTSDGDSCDWRRKRLHWVVEQVGKTRLSALTELLGVYDHKGVLGTAWNSQPSADDLAAFADAWDGAGEDRDNTGYIVVHPSASREMIRQALGNINEWQGYGE